MLFESSPLPGLLKVGQNSSVSAAWMDSLVTGTLKKIHQRLPIINT